jgi:YD repeat-containing protein
MLRVFGDGQWSFYQGTTTFSSPADDSGVLSAATNGGVTTYTYAYADGRTETFNGAGYETQWASADGQQTLQFRYNASNQLTGMTAIDGGLSTFSYSSGLLSTIQTVNSRTYTFAYSGANLTKVTNPGGGLHTFTYDASHQVLTEAFGGRVNGWAYYSGGALASLVWGAPPGYGQGDTPSPSITPFNAAAAQALTATAPGPLLASRTDADNHTTAWQLDSQGRPLTEYAADGGATQRLLAGVVEWYKCFQSQSRAIAGQEFRRIWKKSEKSRAQNWVERVSSYIEAHRSAWARHLKRS